VSTLYVYAVLRAGARTARIPAGVRLVAAGGVAAAVRAVRRVPAPAAATLGEHDAVVRALAAAAPAVLPVRFGTALPDEAAVRDWLAGAQAALGPALDRVTGREQMMVRLYARGAVAVAPAADDEPRGPGSRYLRARRRDAGWEGLPAELRALRARLRPMVAEERLERHATPPLLATAYHLVRRGAGPAYREAVEFAAADLRQARAAVSGPWPAYAFAPAELP
jgi:hypothetical protein